MSNIPVSHLRSTIRSLLYSTLGIPLLALPLAQAQQAPGTPAGGQQAAAAEEPAKMEKTVVTGSLIPTAETVTAFPLQTITPETIQQSGTSDTLEMLKKLVPGLTGAGNYVGRVNNNVNIYTGQQAYSGESNIALRNLPTAVLIDGRRVTASALSAGQGVDLNTIPLNMIERVEVLQDGASALYGSDAIGGVINIITKQNWNGFEVGGRYGFTTMPDNGMQQYSAYITAGTSSDKARFVAGGQYYYQDALLAKDRDISSLGIFELSQLNLVPPAYVSPSYPGRVQDAGGTWILAGSPFAVGAPGYNAAIVKPFVVPGFSGNSVDAYNTAVLANPNNPYPGFAPYINATNAPLMNLPGGGPNSAYSTLNTTEFGTTSILQTDRRNYFANFEYDLFDKHATLFTSFLYADNFATGQLAPSPVPTLLQYGIYVPASNGYNPFGIDLGDVPGSGPVGTPRIRHRFVDFGNRTFESYTDFYRFVGGLKGQITEDYQYNAAYTYSKDSQQQLTKNAVNGAALNLALSPAPAGTPPDPQGRPLSALHDSNFNYVPQYNIFALGGQQAPETLALLNTTLYTTGIADLWTVDGQVTGAPFDLPAGKLQFAIGGSYMSQSLQLSVDGLTQLGLAPGLNAGTPFPKGTQTQSAGYIQVDVPVFSEQNKIPGFYGLDITAAGRYTKIDPGGDKAVPQVGVKWQPLDKQFTLRGSYSQGFIAPAIYNLYGAPSVSNPSLVTPVPGDPTQTEYGQVTTTTYANPNLGPADSTQWNGGIVITPEKIKGLTVSVDYYAVKESNIPVADPVAAMKSLNQFGAASPYASGPLGSFVFADGTTLAQQPNPNAPNQVGVSNWGNLNYTFQPGGSVKTDGFDFAATYVLPLEEEKFGKITLFANANWILNYEFQNDPSLPYYEYKGQYTTGWGGSQGMIPDFSIYTSLTYEIQNFTFVASANYLPAVEAPGFLFPYVGAPEQGATIDGASWHVPSYYTISLQLSYEFGKSKQTKDWYDGTRVTVGCNNVTNNEPLLIAGAVEDNTDKNVYDIIGRTIYFEVAKKF